MSKYEYQYLLVQDWTDQVIDIREQYPLPIEETQRIAKKLNIIHANLHGQDVVQTSDFMLTVPNGENGTMEEARTFKPINKLTKRTLELSNPPD
ncbi:TnsA endonuclease N-terminal domain-containing protein [Paenibacillus sp. Marseille-Q9583]